MPGFLKKMHQRKDCCLMWRAINLRNTDLGSPELDLL